MRSLFAILVLASSAVAAGYPDPFKATRAALTPWVQIADAPDALVKGAPFGERHGSDRARFFGLVLSQRAFQVGLFRAPDGQVRFGLIVGSKVFDPSSPDNSSSRGRNVPRAVLPPGTGGMRVVSLPGGGVYFGEVERGVPQGFGFRLEPSGRPEEWTAHVGGFQAGKPHEYGYRVTRRPGPEDDIREGRFSEGQLLGGQHWRLGVACEMPVDDPGVASAIAATVSTPRGIGDLPAKAEAEALLAARFAKMGAPLSKHRNLGPGDVVQLENGKYYFVKDHADETGVPLLGGRVLYLAMPFRKVTGRDLALSVESYGSYNPRKDPIAPVIQAIDREKMARRDAPSYTLGKSSVQPLQRQPGAGFVPAPVDSGPKYWESRYRVQEMIRSPEKTFQNRYNY